MDGKNAGNRLRISKIVDHERRTTRQRDVWRRIYGHTRNGKINRNMERHRDQTCDKSETGEGLGVPNRNVWSGELVNEKSREDKKLIVEMSDGCHGQREKLTCSKAGESHVERDVKTSASCHVY